MQNAAIAWLAGACLLALPNCQSTKPSAKVAAFGTCAAGSAPVRTVSAEPGTLYLNPTLKQYCIRTAQAGTIDEVTVGVVCGALPKAWQTEGRQVVFSGQYKAYPNPPVAPAGTTFYSLELTSLRAQ